MRICCALLGIALTSCVGGDGDGDGTPASDDGTGDPDNGPSAELPPSATGEPAALAGITAAHNQVRAMVATSTPLPPLVWDPTLAATAAAWVAMCRDQQAPTGLIDHNPNRSVGQPYYVGENVYGTTALPSSSTAQQAVNSWASEAVNYNYATNTCAAGSVCGHYTQIVWRSTTKIGCALGDCPSLRYRTSLVCDYGPGGNISGQRPY
ncbi:MAG TPA: CAP domain-containing protein [Kofleriaceae bacterium]|nr:CAP domain-containing protein [Kofleriaceae bacterium]